MNWFWEIDLKITLDLNCLHLAQFQLNVHLLPNTIYSFFLAKKKADKSSELISWKEKKIFATFCLKNKIHYFQVLMVLYESI